MSPKTYIERIHALHREASSLLKELEDAEDQAKDDYSQASLETIDLHHIIELLPTSAHESARVVTKLRDVRHTRRQAKQMMALFEAVSAHLPGVISNLDNVVSQIEEFSPRIEPQGYIFRTQEMKDFADTFSRVDERMEGYRDSVHFRKQVMRVDTEDRLLKDLDASTPLVSVPLVASPERELNVSDISLYIHHKQNGTGWYSILIDGDDVQSFHHDTLRHFTMDPRIHRATHFQATTATARAHMLNHFQFVLNMSSHKNDAKRFAERLLQNFSSVPVSMKIFRKHYSE